MRSMMRAALVRANDDQVVWFGGCSLVCQLRLSAGDRLAAVCGKRALVCWTGEGGSRKGLGGEIPLRLNSS